MARKAEEKPQQDAETAGQPLDPVARAAQRLKSGLPQYLLLGQVAKLAPGGKPVYEPRISTLSEARAALLARAVRDIAQERFAFPTQRYRDYKTYTNVPQPSMGVEMPDGSVAYPDIVVVQDPENFTKIIGEVATAETVNEQTALKRWKPFAELAPLYIYVPVGHADEARRLIRQHKVEAVGLRTWRYAVGVEQIEINDIFTVPSGPEELLPKILRPAS